MSILEVERLSVFYGPVLGVEDVSLEVGEGEIVALLGANGAGKSTVLKAVSGLVKPRQGAIRFAGENLARVGAATRVRRGVVQVPEGRRIFPALSVRENLELAAFGSGVHRNHRQERVAAVLDRFPLLNGHLTKLAGMLSGGEQQILAIARGMMAEPRLLMVDEPSLGLAPQMVELVYELLGQIAARQTAVLLVEQNVTLAFEITSRAYVLQHGRVALAGQSAELAEDPRVVAAYLGAAAATSAATGEGRAAGAGRAGGSALP